jgi:hypothetical protein|tara:strand:+ start:1156 stop:1341 length:186 start_codon:yes stop_codon:yes gene_type:complete
MRYSVELRRYSDDGDDYSEDYYEFEERDEAIRFAKKNRNEVHSVLDYGSEGKTYDPKYINL